MVCQKAFFLNITKEKWQRGLILPKAAPHCHCFSFLLLFCSAEVSTIYFLFPWYYEPNLNFHTQPLYTTTHSSNSNGLVQSQCVCYHPICCTSFWKPLLLIRKNPECIILSSQDYAQAFLFSLLCALFSILIKNLYIVLLTIYLYLTCCTPATSLQINPL